MPLPVETRERVDRTLERVRHLVSLYEAYVGQGQGRRDIRASDVLRAATVLLHATLEQLLRDLATQYLPAAPREALDVVPLVGIKGRAEKFLLGALAEHREKQVSDLIRESVDAYLSKVNYNDTEDVAVLLRSVGIDTARVNGRFADLEALMQRRHQIVHQADRNPERGRGQHWAQSIGRHTVLRWIEAVEDFVAAVDAQVP
jgi:hypothetical protein